ncbi:MAG TPA: hypothetical protein VK966_06450, partial [Longimicrobiales bacterium]|nr:hypothetical protein [Longimicrobiales bacterium]
MRNTYWRRWAPLALAVAFFAACDDDPAEPDPSISDFDAAATADQVTRVLDSIEGNENAFLGLNAAATALSGYWGTASVSAEVRQAPRQTAALFERTDAIRALRAPLALTGSMTLPAARLVLPEEIEGRTLVWSVEEDQYVVDPEREDAPANGVRLVLYAMHPTFGTPLEPLEPLGYIELTDEDDDVWERLGIRVVDTEVEPALTLLDYDVEYQTAGDESAGQMATRAVGELTNGTETLAFDLLQNFAWDEAADSDMLDLTYAYAFGDDASMVLEMDATGGFEAAVYDVVDVGLVLENGENRVDFLASIDETSAVDGEILLDGVQVVEITGVDGSPTFRRPDGGDLTQQEINALVTVWSGVAISLQLSAWFYAPATLLL